MAGTVKFALDAVEVEFPAYNFPNQPFESSGQVVSQTDDGDTLVDKVGPGFTQRVLPFENVTTTQINALKSFVQSTIEYAKTLFTWTDVDDTEYSSVRWIDTAWQAQEIFQDSWSIVITLQFE